MIFCVCLGLLVLHSGTVGLDPLCCQYITKQSELSINTPTTIAKIIKEQCLQQRLATEAYALLQTIKIFDSDPDLSLQEQLTEQVQSFLLSDSVSAEEETSQSRGSISVSGSRSRSTSLSLSSVLSSSFQLSSDSNFLARRSSYFRSPFDDFQQLKQTTSESNKTTVTSELRFHRLGMMMIKQNNQNFKQNTQQTLQYGSNLYLQPIISATPTNRRSSLTSMNSSIYTLSIKSLLQPLIVWINDFSFYHGITTGSTLSKLEELRVRKLLHIRFLLDVERSLQLLWSTRKLYGDCIEYRTSLTLEQCHEILTNCCQTSIDKSPITSPTSPNAADLQDQETSPTVSNLSLSEFFNTAAPYSLSHPNVRVDVNDLFLLLCLEFTLIKPLHTVNTILLNQIKIQQQNQDVKLQHHIYQQTITQNFDPIQAAVNDAVRVKQAYIQANNQQQQQKQLNQNDSIDDAKPVVVVSSFDTEISLLIIRIDLLVHCLAASFCHPSVCSLSSLSSSLDFSSFSSHVSFYRSFLHRIIPHLSTRQNFITKLYNHCQKVNKYSKGIERVGNAVS